MSYQIGKLLRDRCTHHHNGIIDAGLTEGDAFIDGGDRETADGQPLESTRHLDGAVAIGVGLDDGQHV